MSVFSHTLVAAVSRHLGIIFTSPKLYCRGRMNLTNPCVCWWCLLIRALHHLIPCTALTHVAAPADSCHLGISFTTPKLYCRGRMNLTNPCVCWWCLLIHALHHLIPCTALTHTWQQQQTAAILELVSLLQNCIVEGGWTLPIHVYADGVSWYTLSITWYRARLSHTWQQQTAAILELVSLLQNCIVEGGWTLPIHVYADGVSWYTLSITWYRAQLSHTWQQQTAAILELVSLLQNCIVEGGWTLPIHVYADGVSWYMLSITWYRARLSHTGGSSRQPPSWN